MSSTRRSDSSTQPASGASPSSRRASRGARSADVCWCGCSPPSPALPSPQTAIAVCSSRSRSNGHVEGIDTLGGIIQDEFGVIASFLMPLIGLALVAGMTRREEESGRLEALLAGRIDRRVPAVSALVLVGAAVVMMDVGFVPSLLPGSSSARRALRLGSRHGDRRLRRARRGLRPGGPAQQGYLCARLRGRRALVHLAGCRRRQRHVLGVALPARLAGEDRALRRSTPGTGPSAR